jgi:hypothetical protein
MKSAVAAKRTGIAQVAGVRLRQGKQSWPILRISLHNFR